MGKDVSFSGKPPSRQSQRVAEAIEGLQPEPEQTKRLTVDLPLSLHSRVKVKCAEQNTTIAKVIREFLTRKFPEDT